MPDKQNGGSGLIRYDSCEYICSFPYDAILAPQAAGNTTLSDLKYYLMNAEEIYHEKTWKPVDVKKILELAKDNDLRIVENGQQLLKLIIDSLERLEKTLHGSPPAVNDLWNDKQTHRDENHLSDYIVRFLQTDLKNKGFFFYREVQIRRLPGSGMGQRTDILVELSIQSADGAKDSIVVIIEVKGSWNNELATAMEKQLLNQYIQDNTNCRYGLYLVGWFNCSFDLHTVRLPDHDGGSQKFTIKEARYAFSKQAADLSKNTNNITIKSFVLDACLKN